MSRSWVDAVRLRNVPIMGQVSAKHRLSRWLKKNSLTASKQPPWHWEGGFPPLRRVGVGWQGRGSCLAWDVGSTGWQFGNVSTVSPEQQKNRSFCQRCGTSQNHKCLIFHEMLKQAHPATSMSAALPILLRSTWKSWQTAHLHTSEGHLCTNCPQWQSFWHTAWLCFHPEKRDWGTFPSNSLWQPNRRGATRPHWDPAAQVLTSAAKLYFHPMTEGSGWRCVQADIVFASMPKYPEHYHESLQLGTASVVLYTGKPSPGLPGMMLSTSRQHRLCWPRLFNSTNFSLQKLSKERPLRHHLSTLF